jgi:PAS domain S-box-containing protein
MPADSHGPSLRSLRRWPALGPRATLLLALCLFAAVFALRGLHPRLSDADDVLFVLPIALLALRFGLRGGSAGALLGLALVLAWDVEREAGLTAAGFVTRAVAFILLGALLGAFVDARRELEEELVRHYDASLDLLATSNFDGRLTRANRAWERVLGHSPETMCSRPFIEFVHPDDREATVAEAAALAEGTRDTVRFRNRYRTADGHYRWLEWSAHASASERKIHAVARDVSLQREAEQQLANHAQLLEARVAERTRELEAARAETLQRLALAAEYRDDDTSQHTERVGDMSARVAERLGLDAGQQALLREAAPLHDVGKLAIPDTILLKPGRLTQEEYEAMKTHAMLGARLLSGSSSPVLQMAAVIAASHHERWDGTGYPAGLAGEAIPLVGRIVAVADVFDALTHERPYKSLWPVEQAIAEIRSAAGTQFDPRVVDAFLEIQAEAPPPSLFGGTRRPARRAPGRRRTAGAAAARRLAQPAGRV